MKAQVENHTATTQPKTQTQDTKQTVQASMNQEALSHKAKNPKHETMSQEALSHSEIGSEM